MYRWGQFFPDGIAEVVADVSSDLPRGSHAVAFYAGEEERAEVASRFISGAPVGQAVGFWVLDFRTDGQDNDRLGSRLRITWGASRRSARRRSSPARVAFGPWPRFADSCRTTRRASRAGRTPSRTTSRTRTPPSHLKYESWFQSLPREASRFLCPYALRRIPPESAPEIMRELGKDHSHVVLSSSPGPAVRLLQLFLFTSSAESPERAHAELRWARNRGSVYLARRRDTLELTPAGRRGPPRVGPIGRTPPNSTGTSPAGPHGVLRGYRRQIWIRSTSSGSTSRSSLTGQPMLEARATSEVKETIGTDESPSRPSECSTGSGRSS